MRRLTKRVKTTDEITITLTESGRLDKLIADGTDISRSFAQKLCADGLVKVNGKVAQKNHKAEAGDVVDIIIPEPEEMSAEAEDIPLDIVYEDDDVIVVNKPKGMVVHPAPGNTSGTLVNALMYHCGGGLSAINGVVRPGIVHRIDKDTSGLLAAAKNNEAHVRLAAQLKERKALRRYVALVNGNIKEDELTINKPIGRNPSDRKKMAVVAGGREAVTHVRVLERFGRYTLVECRLETGRTHQIRVHMASVGHSIVGDKTYGISNEKFNLSGQLLHAEGIGFEHPRTGKLIELHADIPEDFKNVLDILRKSSK
ncbi:MAG TPA: RluA family pseudouridine synthase [Candidatus Ornithomonoglobus intestinigallinarum]|uniref:Pseudouridine synthase n=1 Tax=Candidatus Ornithomonoglobus intestinigallinarum TaxID=2840894 RepID=A0A9D1H4F5_9FIRM|nr:RluA family pseudouridine synthase [Candidatus Ornithomonoglobus intestinigallinarum]